MRPTRRIFSVQSAMSGNVVGYSYLVLTCYVLLMHGIIVQSIKLGISPHVDASRPKLLQHRSGSHYFVSPRTIIQVET